MLHFESWKIAIIALICAAGVVFSVPNLIPAATLGALPSFLPHHQVNLGLDLRGGSRLLYEVDLQRALAERLDGVVDSARVALRTANLGYTRLAVQGDAV